MNFECDFTRDRPLPIVAVDELIYRRLPAFMIATVDKFAALLRVGQVGVLLGGANRYDASGFYDAAEPGRGQHLSAPLQIPTSSSRTSYTLFPARWERWSGLYEAAIEALCVQEIEGRPMRPKIIASTATVRQARDQIQALFARPRRPKSFHRRVLISGIHSLRALSSHPILPPACISVSRRRAGIPSCSCVKSGSR